MKTSDAFPPLTNRWKALLSSELEQNYITELNTFLYEAADTGVTILPQQNLWFNALNSTAPEQVKVVILGQDPYPTQGHAHGLCFSVLPNVKPLPKSLNNIYKELYEDLGIKNENGHLQSWANQGVLMLNSVLTVESGQANSHQGKGWEKLTDKIIDIVNSQEQACVFVLWGAYAQKKAAAIDETRHLVIRSPHPSPLSAYRGFFGSKPFSQINQFLREHGQSEINWQV